MSRCTCGAERVYAGRALELCERCGVLATVQEGGADELWIPPGFVVRRTRGDTGLASAYRSPARSDVGRHEYRLHRGWIRVAPSGLRSAIAFVGFLALGATLAALGARHESGSTTAIAMWTMLVVGTLGTAFAAIGRRPERVAISDAEVVWSKLASRPGAWRRRAGDRVGHTATPSLQNETAARHRVFLERADRSETAIVFACISAAEARHVAFLLSLLLERAVPVDDDAV